ncbi:MAG TPA: serine hydrolase [Solirubrobacteraceae bacterium]|nr:serine hydrolase [Solirubrobacteraceae bacterium]
MAGGKRRNGMLFALAALLLVPAARASALPPTPEPRLIAWGGVGEAQRWARERDGSVSFAVVDGRRIRGRAVDRRYPSASVVKAMLALAVVRDARGRELTSGERALLGPMIRVSDNAAASTVYRRIGGDGLRRVAAVARMTRFADVGNWADAQLTAADQAKLFLRIDRLAPRRHRAYLRHLLASIVPSQRWGIAPVASERGFTIMFKGGWRTRIAHQVALLERDGRRIALAVLTSGTGDGYGRATQAGIAARVLAERPPRR